MMVWTVQSLTESSAQDTNMYDHLRDIVKTYQTTSLTMSRG